MNAPIEATSHLPAVAQRDDRSGVWFDHLADGVLMLRRCATCGHIARPDSTACPACHDEASSWSPSTGSGTVVSLIVDHAAARSGGPQVVLGLVELDEGPWLHARLLPSHAAGTPGTSELVSPAGDPAIGDRVELVVLVEPGSEPIPAFRRDL